jgi:hypothetical protein
MEVNEEKLTLKQLKECAKVLDCELVYALKPRQRFSWKIWHTVASHLKRPPAAWLVNHTMHDPRFRRRVGWARNHLPAAYDSVWLWRRQRDFERQVPVTPVTSKDPPIFQ